MFAVLDPNVKVMNRKKLMSAVSLKAQKDHDDTVAMLAKSKYVATSADIWSCSNHGYMGMIATTINANFERVSRAIACKHFPNPHSGQRVAEIIIDVHQSYDLELSKLVGTITDNGGNLVKAFGIGAVDSNIQYLLQELDELSNTLPKHQR